MKEAAKEGANHVISTECDPGSTERRTCAEEREGDGEEEEEDDEAQVLPQAADEEEEGDDEPRPEVDAER